MFFVADDLRAGRLVSILQEFLQDEHAINAIYPHRQHVSAKVRSFIDLSIRYFREHPTWGGAQKARNRMCAQSQSFRCGHG
jgi:DNA-binding transcriptional LysR family regulator